MTPDAPPPAEQFESFVALFPRPGAAPGAGCRLESYLARLWRAAFREPAGGVANPLATAFPDLRAVRADAPVGPPDDVELAGVDFAAEVFAEFAWDGPAPPRDPLVVSLGLVPYPDERTGEWILRGRRYAVPFFLRTQDEVDGLTAARRRRLEGTPRGTATPGGKKGRGQERVPPPGGWVSARRIVLGVGDMLDGTVYRALAGAIRVLAEDATAWHPKLPAARVAADPLLGARAGALLGAVADRVRRALRASLARLTDAANPLARLTQRRELSHYGPGGIDPKSVADLPLRDVRDDVDRGRVCPVQTPQGPGVGFRLYLARNARVDVAARAVVPGPDGDILGDAAALIPFVEHDDVARALMGANMMRQALPLAAPQAPMVGTGWEAEVARRVPLPPGFADGDRLALGTHLFAAYLPWGLDGFEDGLVVSASAADALATEEALALVFEARTQTDPWTGTEQWVAIAPDNPHLSDADHARLADGVVALPDGAVAVGPGSVLVSAVKGTVPPSAKAQLAEFVDRRVAVVARGAIPDDARDASLRVPAGFRGRVVRVTQVRRGGASGPGALLPKGVFRRIVVELRRSRPLCLGDKLAGRHGNKGVVARILPDEDMPFLAVDAAHPARCTSARCPARGAPHRHAQLLLNPLGVTGRLNVGQLFETALARCVEAEGAGRADVPPFDTALTAAALADRSAACGLDRGGKEQLYLCDAAGTPVPLDHPTLVGPHYVLRLRHIAADKEHGRGAGGPWLYSRRDRQPLAGKQRRGGQRVGEMEVWAMAAHGGWATLDELLTYKSDDSRLRRWLARGGAVERLRGLLEAGPAAADPPEDEAAFVRRCVGVVGEEWGVSVEWLNARAGLDSPPAQPEANGEAAGRPIARAVAALGAPRPLAEEGHRRPQSLVNLLLVLRAMGLDPRLLDGTGAADVTAAFLRNRSGSTYRAFAVRLAPPGALAGWHGERDDDERACVRVTEPALRAAGAPHPDGLISDAIFPPGRDWYLGQLDLPLPVVHPLVARTAWKLFTRFDRAALARLWPEAVEQFGWQNGVPDDWGFRLQEALGRDAPPERKIRFPFGWSARLAHAIASGQLAAWPATPAEKRAADAAGRLRKRVGGRFAPKDLLVRELAVLPPRFLDAAPGRVPRKDSLAGRYLELLTQATRLADWAARTKTDAERAPEFAKLPVMVREHWALVCEAVYRLLVGAAPGDGSLLGLLRGKYGLLRRAAAGKRVDFSGRGVIVGDPTVPLDAVRLPHKLWAALFPNDSPGAAGRRLVLLNRQPTLHRYSIQAFEAAPGEPADAVIRLNPFVCRGFNADFDGDTMAVYAPVTAAARAEAERLVPSRNLFGQSSGELVPGFGGDIALGAAYLTRGEPYSDLVPPGLAPPPAARADGDRYESGGCVTTAGRARLRAILPAAVELPNRALGKGDWGRLVTAVARREATAPGTTGAFTLALAELLTRALKWSGLSLSVADFAAAVGRAGPPPGLLELMAVAGTKGDPNAIASPRGAMKHLQDDPDFQPRVECSLLDGHTPDDYTRSAHGARSGLADKLLNTAPAGVLLRALVYALQNVFVADLDDCEATAGVTGVYGPSVRGRHPVAAGPAPADGAEVAFRSPLECRAVARDRGRLTLCRRCYGHDPATGAPPVTGLPVGVLAAHAVGERATQLKLKAFHTGGGKAAGGFDLDELQLRIASAARVPKGGEAKWLNDLVAVFAGVDDAPRRVHFEVLLLGLRARPFGGKAEAPEPEAPKRSPERVKRAAVRRMRRLNDRVGVLTRLTFDANPAMLWAAAAGSTDDLFGVISRVVSGRLTGHRVAAREVGDGEVEGDARDDHRRGDEREGAGGEGGGAGAGHRDPAEPGGADGPRGPDGAGATPAGAAT